MNKWFMHNPEMIGEKEKHNIRSDFEIQTGYLIPARGQDK